MSHALLDINIIIAILDEAHVHHEIAAQWFCQNHKNGWATCPLVINGVMRIMSGSKPYSFKVVDVASKINGMIVSPHHSFWPDNLVMANDPLFCFKHITGNKQITDVYLLALAVKNNGRFVTLDGNIHLPTVKGAGTNHFQKLLP